MPKTAAVEGSVGVYCTVSMCVHGETPLGADLRAALVSLCLEHRLLESTCAFGVVEQVQPSGIGEWLEKHVLRRELGMSLGAQVGRPIGGTSFKPGVKVLESASAGRWLAVRAQEAGSDFIIGCDTPFWKDDDSVTQGFRYAALSAATAIHTFDAYRAGNEGDEYVGSFFDVLTLCAKRNLDGRIAASSSFVRAVKAKLGVKVTCHASWW
jgi:hypothetical protein